MTYDPITVILFVLSLAMIGGGVTLAFIGRSKVFPVAPAGGAAPVAQPRWWWGIGGGIALAIMGLLGLGQYVSWLALLLAAALGVTIVVFAALLVRGNGWMWIGIVLGALLALGALAYLIPYFGKISLPNWSASQPAAGAVNMTQEELDAYVSAQVQKALASPTGAAQPPAVGSGAGAAETPVGEAAPSVDKYLSSQVIKAQNTTDVPEWLAAYGVASRSGDEEADTYAYAPRHAYLIVAAKFNGIENAVHLVYVSAKTEQYLEALDCEVIPALQGELISNVYLDGLKLAAYKAAIKGLDELPFYTWTLQDDGTLVPGIAK